MSPKHPSLMESVTSNIRELVDEIQNIHILTPTPEPVPEANLPRDRKKSAKPNARKPLGGKKALKVKKPAAKKTASKKSTTKKNQREKSHNHEEREHDAAGERGGKTQESREGTSSPSDGKDHRQENRVEKISEEDRIAENRDEETREPSLGGVRLRHRLRRHFLQAA